MQKSLNRRLTQAEIDKIIKNVKATLRIEGLEQNEFSKEISHKYLSGEITSEEAIWMITENILKKRADQNGKP